MSEKNKKNGCFLRGVFCGHTSFKTKKGKDVSMIGVKTGMLDISKIMLPEGFQINITEGEVVEVPVRVSSFNNEVSYFYDTGEF